MPKVGLGVFEMKEGEEVYNAVSKAIQFGYRSFDTASVYQNETGVGKAIKNSDIPREEIFVTTKVWNLDLGFDQTLNAFEKSRKKLDVEYIDLYLIHWPINILYLESWKAIEKLYKEGYVRAIGVCNFHEKHIENIISQFEIAPMVNQIECHPRLTQSKLVDYCNTKGITVEGWSPFAHGQILKFKTIDTISKKYGKSPAQIIIRWNIQRGIIAIPKSVTPDRLKENFDVFNFNLLDEDMRTINLLNKNERIGPNPDKL
ncbi:aldo/keto reductase [Cytobacillus horneckiae]|uniref:aldo/keto reductase n=1 Tax=Cytobacillus horneckiae TaxID=549687 RepID=UPI0039A0E473